MSISPAKLVKGPARGRVTKPSKRLHGRHAARHAVETDSDGIAPNWKYWITNLGEFVDDGTNLNEF